MRRLPLAFLALFLATAPSLAQEPKSSWENLNQLQPGHKIQVVDMRLKSWKGQLVAVSEESIKVRAGEKEITVDRSEVLRVADRGCSKRPRNALIGLGIGSAVGAAAVAGADDLVPWGKVVIAVGFFGGPGAAVAYQTSHWATGGLMAGGLWSSTVA